jgi:hypothetical protein
VCMENFIVLSLVSRRFFSFLLFASLELRNSSVFGVLVLPARSLGRDYECGWFGGVDEEDGDG